MPPTNITCRLLTYAPKFFSYALSIKHDIARPGTDHEMLLRCFTCTSKMYWACRPRASALTQKYHAPLKGSLGTLLSAHFRPGSLISISHAPNAFQAHLSSHLPWHTSSHQYLQYVNRYVTDSILPYWRAVPSWSSWQAVIHKAGQWLPSLPGPYFHVPVLSALNLVGTGIPRTLAFIMFELLRSSREARALSFDRSSAKAAAEAEALAEAMALAARPWWRSLSMQWLSTVWHVTRLTWLLFIFMPVFLSAPLALKWNLYRSEWMELLRKTLETAGAFFIKWGQWAATRHDIFPPDMCKELSLLQTQAPAHRFFHTQQTVEAAFGMPLDDIFEFIEMRPVASGSIGQIHRAKLSKKGAAITGCHPGAIVAVKVRHPGTADTIIHDFETMLWVASIVSNAPALSKLRLEDTLNQFASPLKEQIDLAREASNLQQFNYNFRRSHHVQFPVPLYPLVSADVLVETFEEGDHITSYIEAKNNPYNHRLSELGSELMLQMMLVDNLIHSDLHPGNILVRLNPPKGLLGIMYRAIGGIKASDQIGERTRSRLEKLQQRWLRPQIVLLDVGMATEMSDEDQTNMIGLFRSFAMMDGRTCGNWVLRFSGQDQACPDPEGFKAEMERTFNLIQRQAEEEGSTGFNNSAEALSNVLELIRQHQVSLPGHICAVVVTTLVLEGWSNKLDPDHSVLTQVKKMFEAADVPWGERIQRAVDYIMDHEDNQVALL
ncbi:hypothetical protein CEUSTIGMA_g9123.t1 [Chlamydomonas eustigma]|uniref:ABC1 atypical kinase-like domain-containing protein n=1 Tax=Chlamydomonas eustigma TaxID=1157962 RepID=A0A250XF35_9CHLO|nr:hypothetical protein CEUSTIGMA_g9123.t1 [Chlamydomonas eustigma]|eukprot:GAX81695.1 hypothetical protein CEUSTIGMA_g9123.t1 [Chlamydomonas eustigma]